MSKAAQNKLQTGMMGLFEEVEPFKKAVSAIASEKFKNWDVYTPFPIHGLEELQGLKRSLLPFIVLAGGLTGCSCGFLLEFWTSAVDWPIIIGGKPFNSWPAFVPVMFELTVLFSGLSNLLGMFFLNGLPNLTRQIPDPRISAGHFAIVVEGEQNELRAKQALQDLGATEVRSIVLNKGWF